MRFWNYTDNGTEGAKTTQLFQKHQENKIDMLNGSIRNKLPLFALPVAATAVLEQLFNAAAWPWWA